MSYNVFILKKVFYPVTMTNFNITQQSCVVQVCTVFIIYNAKSGLYNNALQQKRGMTEMSHS